MPQMSEEEIVRTPNLERSNDSELLGVPFQSGPEHLLDQAIPLTG